MLRRHAHSALVLLPLIALFLIGGPADLLSPRTPNHHARLNALAATKEIRPYDKPSEAADFYRLKRAPKGQDDIPVDRYLSAIEHTKKMNEYSTVLNAFLPSEEKSTPATRQMAVLNNWQQLGPGNIGGRTRAIVINPSNAAIMYAGGVAGGVWKTTNAGSSWAPLDDLLPNLSVCSLAMDPANTSVLYAGTGEGFFNIDAVSGAGVFKTTDAGATWTRLTNTSNSSFSAVNDIVVSPNNSQRVYAATGSGVFRSTDGGLSWASVLSTGVTGGCLDLAIRTDQVTDFVFASFGNFQQATVFRNTDAGGSGTWGPVLTEAGMGRTSLAIAPSDQNIIYALSASVAPGPFGNGLNAVFRSISGGGSGTWTARVRNTDLTKLNTLLLTNPVFASFSNCGFGADQFLNQGWYDNVIAVDPADPNRVWTGGTDLFRSDNGGASWGLASYWWADKIEPQYAHADQHVIIFHPQYNGTTNRILFVGNDGGIFRTNNARAATAVGSTAACDPSNGGVAWTSLNNNYGVTQFYNGTQYPDGLTYFAGAQDNGTLRGNDISGVNAWEQIQGGDGGYVAIDRVNPSILYAEFFGLSINKSTNGGTSFSPATTGITESPGNFLFIVPFAMDPSNSQRLWTGGFFLWRTSNGAGNWTQASAVTAGDGKVSAVANAPTNPNNVLAGMSDGLIHRTNIGLSSNSSTVWPFTQPREGFVSSVAFDPTNANIAYATYSTFNSLPTDRHVYKTTDAGATWAGIDGVNFTAIPDIPVHSIVVDPTNTSRLYVGTDLGVFVSIDGGLRWARENTGFANAVTESLSINTVGSAASLFAFTHGRGAWRVRTTPSCSSLSALSAIFTRLGGTGSIDVKATAACAWAATSNAGFINITSGPGGTGNGLVTFSVANNPGPLPRQGTMTIGGETFTVSQSVDFLDVPAQHPFYQEIGKIAALGVTLGCGNGNFCPDAFVTREQMAIFIERALGVFTPPTPMGQSFSDVPASRIGFAFIEDLAKRGITNGCALNQFCPDALVTREQMAIFLERAIGVFDPPFPIAQTFTDVPPSRIGYRFIEDFARRGITLGCGMNMYCPDGVVTRAQMAAFLSRGLGL